MEEILPAARLLSRATAVTPLDYERAKSAFLEHMQRAGVAAAELGAQVATATRTSYPIHFFGKSNLTWASACCTGGRTHVGKPAP